MVISLRPVIGRAQLGRRLRRFWREYTRMRTAIFFLIGLVLMVAVGAVVPQDQTSDPTQVQQFLSANSHLNALASAVGFPLTQVYVSVDFFILLASLFIALGACVIGRGQALIRRTVRGHPRNSQYWGEWFSWLFHSSFFLLLVAVVFGKATGFQGLMVIVEGQTVSEARSDYATLQEGLLFNGQHRDFQLRLDKFTVQYQPDGAASTYDSRVTVLDHGRSVLTKSIQVNDYLNYDGIHFYQEDYGWAPEVVITNPAGRVVFDGPIEVFGDNYSVQSGVLKVPDFDYTPPGSGQSLQLGANTLFMPDALDVPSVNGSGELTGLTVQPGGLSPDNPVLQLQFFAGNLGLNSGQPQNVNTLDTSQMAPLGNGAPVDVTVGQTAAVPFTTAGGKTASFTVSVPALQQYTVLMANYDNGVPLVYASFVLILLGITGKLYLKPLLERRERRLRISVAADPIRATSDHDPGSRPGGAGPELLGPPQLGLVGPGQRVGSGLAPRSGRAAGGRTSRAAEPAGSVRREKRRTPATGPRRRPGSPGAGT
ncbi:MAG TPA: cytochrome c biogenesis protein ResB [Candidatus Binatia bacterium]|nr:cytochrome c biogenesis protein ResB [Candidatus Binatia bacterium]